MWHCIALQLVQLFAELERMAFNTAISKLRAVLCDSTAKPIYVERVPRQGYRFVAPVVLRDVQTALSESTQSPAENPAEADGGESQPAVVEPAHGHRRQ